MFKRRKARILEMEEEIFVLTRKVWQLTKEKENLQSRLDAKYGLLDTDDLQELPVCKAWYCSSCAMCKKHMDGAGGFFNVCMKDIPCEGFVYKPKQ